MGDNPGKTLKWLERELLAEEEPLPVPEKKSSGKPEAVFVKSRRQLRQEAKRKKKAQKQEKVNRKIGDLVILAVLEIIGILSIIGWWLQ